MSTLVLGAVAYDAKVVTIWDGFKRWFAQRGLAFDYVLYTNYERQVEAHLRGEVDVAWNSPLAWLESRAPRRAPRPHARAIAMRDTDQDLTSSSSCAPTRPVITRSPTCAGAASPSARTTRRRRRSSRSLHLAEAGVDPQRDST
jgi:phosphonate transport system substrate-binding protein